MISNAFNLVLVLLFEEKRMKLINIMALSVVFISLSMGSAIAGGNNIAFVQVQKILAKSPKVKAIEKKMEREFSKRKEGIISKGKDLARLEKRYQKDIEIMSDSEAKRLERDIISRRRALKNLQGEFQEDFVLRRNEELGKLQKHIREVIKKIAKEEGLDIVLEGGVVYTSERADITDKVLQKMK